MRTITAFSLVGVAALLLGGCSRGAVFNHARPDEFAVQRQAPLQIPPDFALTPPQQGTPRPSTTVQQETLNAMFGGPAPRSDVETKTIGSAGTAEPGIRSTVGDPGTHSVAKGPVTREILAAPEGDGREASVSISG